ncbi:MAG: Hpt domain-containing protein [Sinobacterium sp.]|nr:Hpt domain-containing protein [Sinobacterium sp.]
MSLTPEDDFNDEIVEIFVEEVDEVLDIIDANFPVWKDNTDDDASLKEMRRAYHTLKGSGRMVQAEELGEVAGSIETILNRLLDRTLEATPTIFDLLSDVRQAVPALVAAFKIRQAASLSGVNCELLLERANSILSGKDTTVFEQANVAGQNTVSDEEPQAQLQAPLNADAQQEIQSLTQQIVELKRDLVAVSTQLDTLSAKVNLLPKATSTAEVDSKLSSFAQQLVDVERQVEVSSGNVVKQSDAARQKLSAKFEKDLKNVEDLTGQLKADFNYAASQLSSRTNAIAIKWSVLIVSVTGVSAYILTNLV